MQTLPTTLWRFLFYFMRQQWFKFSIIFLASTLMAINDAIYPYFLKQIVNSLNQYDGPKAEVFTAISVPVILLTLSWAITEIFQRLQGIVAIYAFPALRAAIRNEAFTYVQGHSPHYFANEFAGNLAKKISDLPNKCQNIVEIISYQFITVFFGCAIVIWLMWRAQPIFALILLAWIIIHLMISFFGAHLGNRFWARHADAESKLSGKIVDVITNILTVHLFARKKFEYEYLQSFQQEEIYKAQKANWVMEITRLAFTVNGLFLILGMTYCLIYGWSKGWVTLGDFTQISMQSFWLLGWLWYLSYQLIVLARDSGSINNALTLLRKPHDLVDQPNAKSIKIHSGAIEFRDIYFNYHKNNYLFSNLSIHIPPGQKVGLVGFSGSGKTTFVNLLLRFYQIQAGHIYIDDQDIYEVTQESLRENITVIPQDPSLFHRSLMENIRYGRPNATDEEVIAASKLAHCHEFIKVLDEKYQTVVGERGLKLSGGQRQRIAIARAILKRAPILILDEATSALDSVTEKLIQKSLTDLMKRQTTIVIAHRLSTIAGMDRILVFHEGKIIEDGTYESLLKANGHFAKLWQLQKEGFLPKTVDEENQKLEEV